MTVAVFLVFFLLLLLAVPVSYALIIAGGVAVIFSQGLIPPPVIAQQVYGQTQSEVLLAIPFFILAGEILIAGGLGERLIQFASRLVGRFTGGLSQVTVMASMVFSGVSGSAVADASAVGSVCIPWQKRQNYPAPFTAAVNASTSTLGVVIPPSIPMIIYATVSGASIGALFLSGLVPGAILIAALMVTCWWVAKKNGYPKSEQPFEWRALGREFLATIPALAMPVLILVCIIGGITTVTEVSVIAVFYALAVSLLLYGDLTLAKLWRSLVRAGLMTGTILLIIMASSLVAYVLTVQEVPARLTESFFSVTTSTILVILFMNVVMLIVGCFIDMPPAILILTPVFIPLAEAIGMDLVQLGIMMTINLGIGLFTPPVGTVLFVSSSIAGVKIEETAKALIPFYLIALAVLLLISFIPALTIAS